MRICDAAMRAGFPGDGGAGLSSPRGPPGVPSAGGRCPAGYASPWLLGDDTRLPPTDCHSAMDAESASKLSKLPPAAASFDRRFGARALSGTHCRPATATGCIASLKRQKYSSHSRTRCGPMRPRSGPVVLAAAHEYDALTSGPTSDPSDGTDVGGGVATSCGASDAAGLLSELPASAAVEWAWSCKLPTSTYDDALGTRGRCGIPCIPDFADDASDAPGWGYTPPSMASSASAFAVWRPTSPDASNSAWLSQLKVL
mmetsp:Transcript_29879/g.92202  ORF Transcript_29879/g.92202 Transcript_29879/m.92202 type:complete len:257 (-) Transcript_29879:513-1283(-)